MSDNQYYSEENPINQLQYSSPDPDYYRTPSRRLQTQPHNPTGYYPPPPDPVDIQCWHTVEEESALFSMDIDFLVKRPNHQEPGKPERDNKTITSK